MRRIDIDHHSVNGQIWNMGQEGRNEAKHLGMVKTKGYQVVELRSWWEDVINGDRLLGVSFFLSDG